MSSTTSSLSTLIKNIRSNIQTLTNTMAKKLDSTANAVSASKLATARIISLTGKATGSANFDGSANASINVTAVTADSVAWNNVTDKPGDIVKVTSWDGSTLKLTTNE